MKKLILLVVAIIFAGCAESVGEIPVYEAEEFAASALRESESPVNEIVAVGETEESEFSESAEPTAPPPVSPIISEPVQPVPVETWAVSRVVDFLSDYHSLYSFGVLNPDGTYSDSRMGVILETRPLVVWNHTDNLFLDIQGLPIESAVYLYDVGGAVDGHAIATAFYLYDFENDGILEIIIEWHVLETSFSGQDLFRFVDGEYLLVGEFLDRINFFHDDGGVLIGHINNEMKDIYEFYRFSENGNYEEISGENLSLTPIPPLDVLRDEILTLFRSQVIIPIQQGIYINSADGERLRHFDNAIEMHFLREADSEGLVIWADFHMRDFTLLQIERLQNSGDTSSFAPISEHGTIAEVPVGSAVHITSYAGACAFPNVGISFIDENNEARYFAFDWNYDDFHLPRLPFYIFEFEYQDGESVPRTENGEQSRLLAEAFLSDYFSLYSFGELNPDGTYRDSWTGVIHETRPLVVIEYLLNGGFEITDNHGLPIESAVFLYDVVGLDDGRGIARSFYLYDFENDGLLEIIIGWNSVNSCALGFDLFRLIGGEYLKSGSLWTFSTFFHDADGNLIVLYDCERDGIHALCRIYFTENGLIHEEISGEGLSLTPILPLDDLRDEILASLGTR